MTKHRNALPQLAGGLFLTGAGDETYMMYKKGFEVPNFSLFHLLNDAEATHELEAFYRELTEVAARHGVGMILCGVHYRASRDWGDLLGYSRESLAAVNRRGIELYQTIARDYESAASPIVISGCIGPRGDAYQLNRSMTAEESEDYHAEQIATLAAAGADMITALTFNNVAEAIGLAQAARTAGMPCVVSFTLDATGRLKSGQSLKQAIAAVDAATDRSPAYYMVNCTHPNDFGEAFEPGDWVNRLGGIRPNASSLEKGTLCKLGHLEEGDPIELGRQMGELAARFPHINVWGGCCGTDHVHVEEICGSVAAARASAASRPATRGSGSDVDPDRRSALASETDHHNLPLR